MWQLFKRHFLVAALFSAVINLLMLVPSLFMLQVFDRVFTSRSLETLGMLGLVVVLALLAMFALEAVRARLLAHAGASLDRRLGSDVLADSINRSAFRLKHGGPTLGTPHGQAASLRDVAALRSFLSGPALLAMFDAPWILVYVGICWLFHPVMGYLAAASAMLLALAAYANERLTRAPVLRAQEAQRSADKIVNQLMRNAEVVGVLGMQERAATYWQAAQDQSLGAQGMSGDATSLFSALTKFLRQVVQSGMLTVGAYLVIEQNATSGVTIAATILLGRALAPVEQMVAGWKSFLEARSAWPKLKPWLQTLTPVPTIALPTPTGALKVEQATFVPRAGGEATLSNVSFELAAGEVLVIVGASASGKSTLARVLLGAWQPQRGVVRLDGADIATWPREALGSALGYLPQDVELFEGTVGANIARFHTLPGGGFDSEAVIRAAQQAHAHALILRLPQGYDTPIGEAGAALSGGQRQRIALARALYGNPRLVVLDEPNSNLDEAGEAALAQAISALRASGTTVIAITQRPKLIEVADKVLVLNNGHVERFGSREEFSKPLELAKPPQPSKTSAPDQRRQRPAASTNSPIVVKFGPSTKLVAASPTRTSA